MKTALFIASDHGGFDLKTRLQEKFPDIEWRDLGTESADSVDYPDFADRVAQAVARDGGRGVLICGSGQGMAIRANRYPTIRAALAWSPEVARLSRQHNDANILCLSGRLVAPETNFEILKVFLETAFEGGRHQGRVDKLRRPC